MVHEIAAAFGDSWKVGSTPSRNPPVNNLEMSVPLSVFPYLTSHQPIVMKRIFYIFWLMAPQPDFAQHLQLFGIGHYWFFFAIPEFVLRFITERLHER